jgi:hypothetical protein
MIVMMIKWMMIPSGDGVCTTDWYIDEALILLFSVFVGSALQSTDIVMHLETGQMFSIPTYILGSCRVHYRNTSSNITEGFTWASPCMLTTMCFQFNMLNIYHLYGCHLKGRAIMHDEKLVPHECFFFFFCLWFQTFSHHSHFHVHGDSTILCLCPDLLHFKDAAGETMVPSSTVIVNNFSFTKLV